MDELNNYRSLAIFIVVIVFTITSTTSIILRLVAKRINRARLQVEDYVIMVAQVGKTKSYSNSEKMRFLPNILQFLLYGMGVAVMLGKF